MFIKQVFLIVIKSKEMKELKYWTRVWHSGVKTIGYEDEILGYFVSLETYDKEGGVTEGIPYGYCDSTDVYLQYPSLQFEIDYYKANGNLQTMNIFKEDDYVVLLQTCNGIPDVWGRNMSPGMTFKLNTNSHNYHFSFKKGKTFGSNAWELSVPKISSPDSFISHLLLRKATEEEIKKYQDTEEDNPHILDIKTFKEWSIGDKVLCVSQGSNDTRHPLYKKSYKVNDILTITGFTKTSNSYPYICAVCEGGYVIYIEQYPKDFEKYSKTESTSEQDYISKYKDKDLISIGDFEFCYKKGAKLLMFTGGLEHTFKNAEKFFKSIGLSREDFPGIGVMPTFKTIKELDEFVELLKKQASLVKKQDADLKSDKEDIKKVYKMDDKIIIHGVDFCIDYYSLGYYLHFSNGLKHTGENGSRFLRMFGIEKDKKHVMPVFNSLEELSKWIEELKAKTPLYDFYKNGSITVKESDKEKQEITVKPCTPTESFLSLQTESLLPDPIEFINVERTKYFPQVTEIKY